MYKICSPYSLSHRRSKSNFYRLTWQHFILRAWHDQKGLTFLLDQPGLMRPVYGNRVLGQFVCSAFQLYSVFSPLTRWQAGEIKAPGEQKGLPSDLSRGWEAGESGKVGAAQALALTSPKARNHTMIKGTTEKRLEVSLILVWIIGASFSAGARTSDCWPLVWGQKGCLCVQHFGEFRG